MLTDFIKFAFSAGELSADLHGRGDLEGFALGYKEATNFFVDWRGALHTRPGTRFVDYIVDSDKEYKLFTFSFNAEEEDNYILLFGDRRMWFIQSGEYITSSGEIVPVGNFSPLNIEANDWIQVWRDGVYLYTAIYVGTDDAGKVVSIPHTNITYTLQAADIIYPIETPYDHQDLNDLFFTQYRDEIIITGHNYPPSKLIRRDHSSWSLELINFLEGRHTTIRNISVIDGEGSQTREGFTAFQVSAVLNNGRETAPSYLKISPKYNEGNQFLRITWNAVDGAEFYKLYATDLVNFNSADERQISVLAVPLGYIAEVTGLTYNYTNTTPDYSDNPKLQRNPFDNRLADVFDVDLQVTSAVGLDNVKLENISQTSNFFRAQAIIYGLQARQVKVFNYGTSIRPGDTLAFQTIDTSVQLDTLVEGSNYLLTPDTGGYPKVSSLFGQRRFFANTLNQPATLFASAIRQFDNFSDSFLSSGSFEFEIDAPELSAINHVIPVQRGLFLFSETNIRLLRSSSDGGLTVDTAVVDVVQNSGSNPNITPISILNNVIYFSNLDNTVRALTPSRNPLIYDPIDLGRYSQHLFNRRIKSWAFSGRPYRIIWAVRTDGVLLSCTYAPELGVNAWSKHEIDGRFLDCANISENDEDIIYFITERQIDGVPRKVIERFSSRDIENFSESNHMDMSVEIQASFIEEDIRIITREVPV